MDGPEDFTAAIAMHVAGRHASAAVIALRTLRDAALAELPPDGEGTADDLCNALETVELLAHRLRKRVERGLSEEEEARLPAAEPPKVVPAATADPDLPSQAVPAGRLHHRTRKALAAPRPGTAAWMMLGVMRAGESYTLNELAELAGCTYAAAYQAVEYYPWFTRDGRAVSLSDSGVVEAEKLANGVAAAG